MIDIKEIIPYLYNNKYQIERFNYVRYRKPFIYEQKNDYLI